jgi:hypothetical protein
MTADRPIQSSPAETPRPILVTAAATVMTVAGIAVTLSGLISLFARGPSVSGFEVILHWAFVVLPPILLPVGLLDLVAARGALRGAPWARMAGLAVAVLLALFGLLVLGASGGAGELLSSTAWIVANGFVLYALGVSGTWFADRGR